MRVIGACCLLALTLSVVCSSPVPEQEKRSKRSPDNQSDDDTETQMPSTGKADQDQANTNKEDETHGAPAPKKRKRPVKPEKPQKRSKRAVYEVVEVSPEDLEDELLAEEQYTPPDYGDDDSDYDDDEEVLLVPVPDEDAVSDEIPARSRRGYYGRGRNYGYTLGYRRYGRSAPLADNSDYEDEEEEPTVVAYEVPSDVVEELLAEEDGEDEPEDPLERLSGDRQKLYDLLAETAEQLNGE